MSFNIHAERVVDGDASALTALTLYEAGSTTERTLKSTEFLHITDVIIIDEEAVDISLVADSAAGGRYIVQANIPTKVPLVINFKTPYICPRGVVPKFAGGSGAAARSMCIIQGFITPA